jgi:ribosome-associated translation inhibitor RaiA
MPRRRASTGTRPAAANQLEPQDNNMQIQINTDHHIEGSEARDEWARSVVESALGHLADSVTRVEVHFNLENAGKPGSGDKRCMVEARLNGRPPIAVTNHAEELEAALSGALHKLVHAMERALGRADKHARDARVIPADDAGEFVPSVAPF